MRIRGIKGRLKFGLRNQIDGGNTKKRRLVEGPIWSKRNLVFWMHPSREVREVVELQVWVLGVGLRL